MEEKVQRAFDIANYMAAFAGQKQILKEEFSQNLLHFYNGGSFIISKELITFVKTLKDLIDLKETVIVDENSTPISINIDEFLGQILSKYQYAVNEYYTKYSAISRSRTIESMLDK